MSDYDHSERHTTTVVGLCTLGALIVITGFAYRGCELDNETKRQLMTACLEKTQSPLECKAALDQHTR